MPRHQLFHSKHSGRMHTDSARANLVLQIIFVVEGCVHAPVSLARLAYAFLPAF